MDARGLTAKETIPASRKLGEQDAESMLRAAKALVVSKGKKVQRLSLDGEPDAEAIAAMLGPTGNLRAPTLRVGKTLVVGFNQEAYEEIFD